MSDEAHDKQFTPTRLRRGAGGRLPWSGRPEVAAMRATDKATSLTAGGPIRS